MDEARGQAWREHGFLALLAVLCAVLTVLQFRWTGALSRAEFERLDDGQRNAAEALALDFDRELQSGCEALALTGGEVEGEVISGKVRQWKEAGGRPVFRRIGLALPKEDGLALEWIDAGSGRRSAGSWPAGWRELRENLEAKSEGRMGRPYRNREGMVFELPVRGGRPPERGPGPGGPPREVGWLIFELDRAYLGEVWLPELVKRHLPPAAADFYRVEVFSGEGETLFASGPAERLEPPVSVRFNRQGRDDSRPGGPPADPRWLLSLRRQTGALEEMVASSTRRNLALAFGVNGLILAAGFALIRQTRKSRLLAEERMRFVANVSHELRTPVTVILGAANNLKRGIVRKPEALERYAELILQHGRQLSEMIQEVLDFSMAGQGRVSEAKQAVALQRLIRETVEDLKGELGKMEVEVSLPEKLPEVAGEERELRGVLRNLIGNAAKYGVEGGWIGIAAADSDGKVEVSVSDRGPGIPEAERRRIFEPFFRGAGARAGRTRGSGLGLSLVKGIVEAHGGKVWVCSEAGRGAKFTFSLPVFAGGSDGSEHSVG